MDPLSLAGSVFNGVAGFFGQRSANKTNLKIARETNAANRANQEYQNEWNLNMWNKQNEYNSPSAQRRRLEEAGLNPMYYGLEGNGNAQQLQSADFVATPGAPMLNEGAFLGEGIGNAMKTAAEIQLIQSQTRKTDEEAGLSSLERKLKSATLNSDIVVGNMQIKVTQSLLDLNKEQLKNLAKSLEEADVRISDYNSQIATRAKQMEIAEFNAQTERDFKSAEVELRKRGLDLEEQRIANDLMVALKGLSIAMYNAQTQRGELDLKNSRWSKYLEKEYGLDIAIKNGQLSVLSADYDNKLHGIAESHLRALKLVKEITYGEGNLGQSAFMLDHVVTTNGLARGLYLNNKLHSEGYGKEALRASNNNVSEWKGER